MRDPTRGGVATTLNEIVKNKEFGILIEEREVPVSVGVRSACELLGFDPLYIANEGKALLVVEPSQEDAILKLLHKEKYGQKAKTIGQVIKDNRQKVVLRTAYGVTRSMDMLTAEAMPRIC